MNTAVEISSMMPVNSFKFWNTKVNLSVCLSLCLSLSLSLSLSMYVSVYVFCLSICMYVCQNMTESSAIWPSMWLIDYFTGNLVEYLSYCTVYILSQIEWFLIMPRRLFEFSVCLFRLFCLFVFWGTGIIIPCLAQCSHRNLLCE